MTPKNASRLLGAVVPLMLFAAAPRGLSPGCPAAGPAGTPKARPAAEQTVGARGRVAYVYDGDTVKVRLESGEEKRVRLIGVDTPEYDDPKEEGRLQAFLAKRFATTSLSRKDVRLTFDREAVDAFGRMLAYVWVDERTMFNEVLIREGFGRAYLKFPFDEARMKRFAELEAEARKEGRGVWCREPPAETPATAVESSLGKIIAVRFTCLRTFARRRFKVLAPSEGRFEVLIPSNVLTLFPGSLDYEGRKLLVMGLVEDYQGQAQILVGVPLQLKIVE